MKLLFICKKRVSEYGISVGLDNSAQFLVNHFNRFNIDSKLVSVIDSNSIDKEIYNYNPTHVIIHALWVPSYKLKELLSLARYKNIKFIIRIHSKIPFLANEGIAIEWLKEYKELQKDYPNLIISANSKDGNDGIIKSLVINSIYLPNIYEPSYPAPNTKKSKNKKILNIGCFGAIRPLKNQLIQAIAAIEYGNRYNKIIHFHINSSRAEQKGESVLKNIRSLFKNTNHKLIEYEWKSHEEFLSIIDKMDLGMQVSLTETFNIVTADFVYCGIPIVVSSQIEWASYFSKASCHNINSIVNKMRTNLKCKFLNLLNIYKLFFYNRKASKIWFKYLNT
jgi:hypothetical protein